jgi:N-acetylmuramoyl-L-alanine amidase
MKQPAKEKRDEREVMAFMIRALISIFPAIVPNGGKKVAGSTGTSVIPAKAGIRVFIAIAILLLCMVPLTGPAASKPSGHPVLIDPAHGGEDTGVVSDKLKEKDLNLTLALLIRQEAQKKGLQVQLTRSTDRGMTAEDRAGAAETTKADCIVSIHVNAGFGHTSSGYEIYFPGFQQEVSGDKESSSIIKDMTRNKSLNDSVRLAQQFLSGLEKVFPRKGRNLRDAPSPLLNRLTIPGVAIEIGFATNPEDREKLTDPETQKAIADAIVDGLRNYYASSPK